MTNNIKLIKSFDYLFVLRPMLFFPGWSTMLAGYFISRRADVYLNLSEIQNINNTAVILLLFLSAAAMGAGFLLNQLKDIESDRKNKKLFIISDGHISVKSVIIETIILIILALLGAIYVNVSVFWLTAVFIIVTGYIYNYHPFCFKDFPVRSLLANTAMGWLAFAIGWAVNLDLSWRIIADSLPYLFINTALYLYTTLPDREGDESSGKNTFAVILGLKPVLTAGFILFTAGLISAFFMQDYTALFILLLSAPFFVLTLLKNSVDSAVRTVKFTILFFALAVCLKWPFYFILMLAGFYLTKMYFKTRFNFDYPNFKGK